ncbi:LuxR C-terminal-related transcriptional regulator [Ferdinandcohnia quinoae]|uniref:LuxR C-terminal-related transcriptional regulator n=1 Tax=Fredinandcohnia quinoae TaxID=2918902 RepID=A0AAW5E8A6_9BACI|nr:LuxR C-terminal-related transcriptional regulator [Fredinandcohnia sp. SECRCQ15]MCH1627485.1 LuxR C-terminal-related transcriptional regulator [Fredinandcohnia sp. SECRCQ15]
MNTVWLNSKTVVPSIANTAINRERLLQVLQEGSSTNLTIVQAPGGYGKTTILSQWISHINQPTSWFSIDALDNDPIRFWKYVIQSVSDSLKSDLANRLFPLFHSPLHSPHELIIDSFLNELSTINQYIHIVLDDYHVIEDPTIHEMMTRFIDYLPSNTRVYLLCRTTLPLPLAKWRVQSNLTEIDFEQLSFTYEEVEALYKKKNHLIVDEDRFYQNLLNSTEGWVAGLQMASLSMVTDELHDSRFDGTHPFVTEYLLKEIFRTLSPEIQDFLLQTSVLTMLEPKICNLLTSRSDSYDVLVELVEKGIFTVRLSSARPVFRYHHLFADVLQIEMRNKYPEEQVSSIYKNAGTLLCEKGDYISAIELVLQQKIFHLADAWIKTYLVDIFTSGQIATFVRWIDTFRKDNYSLPYETIVMYTIALTSIPDLKKAKQIIDELEQRNIINQWMDHPDNQGIVSILTTLKAYVLMAIGDEPEKVVEILVNQLKAGRVSSRWDHIPMHYNQFEPKISRTLMGAKGKFSPLNGAIAFSDFLRQTEFKEQNLMGFSYGVLAEIMYEANLLEDALHEIEGGLQYANRFQDSGLAIPLYILKSRIYMAKKQFTSAQAVLDHAIQSVTEWYWVRSLRAMKAHCYLMQFDLINAEMELFKMDRPDILKIELGQEFWLLVYVRLLLNKKNYHEALTISILVKEKASNDEQISTIIEALILEAICYLKIDSHELAISTLHKALELGSAYEYKRIFLDEAEINSLFKKYISFRQKDTSTHWEAVPLSYIEDLIRTCTKIDDKSMRGILTPREMDVLQLLARGASNREIASQLFLSEGTIRVYLTNIYSKLEVQSRTQAILLAKEWNL